MPSVRGDVLERLGRPDEARGLTRNVRERDLVLSERSLTLLRGAVVVVQHAAQALPPAKGTRGIGTPQRLNELVAKALVVPLGVVVRHELRDRAPKVTLPEQNHAIQALLFDRADEPLRVGVGVSRRLHRLRVMTDKRFASRIRSIPSMDVSSDGSTVVRHGVRIASISTTMPGSSPGCRRGGPMSSPLIPPRYLARDAPISGTTISVVSPIC